MPTAAAVLSELKTKPATWMRCTWPVWWPTDPRLTKIQLNKWAKSAVGLQMISEYTVPWLAVENSLAQELALEWMRSKDPAVACQRLVHVLGASVAEGR